MRSIVPKSNKGQVMIINLIFLVMTIVVFTALIPVLRTMMDNARHEDSLNCKSNHNTCGIENESPCYNSSKNSELSMPRRGFPCNLNCAPSPSTIARHRFKPRL